MITWDVEFKATRKGTGEQVYTILAEETEQPSDAATMARRSLAALDNGLGLPGLTCSWWSVVDDSEPLEFFPGPPEDAEEDDEIYDLEIDDTVVVSRKITFTVTLPTQ